MTNETIIPGGNAARFDRNTRILVAPNSYKECASSVLAAQLIAGELTRCGFSSVEQFPLSDGGDGFLDVCAGRYDLQLLPVTVGDCVTGLPAMINIGFDASRKTGYLEAADLIGLKRIGEEYRHPMSLSSEVLGDFLQLVSSSGLGFSALVIGLGGTGITDLGMGLCASFGMKLFDAQWNELKPIPQNFQKVCHIIPPQQMPLSLHVVYDVECPMTGPGGMARTFAAQKGATPEEIDALDAGVQNILTILADQHGIDLRSANFGAGGGVMIGLSLLGEFHPVPSEEFILHHLKLNDAMGRCDVVVTGEGRFDRQSFMNKATGVVVQDACRQQRPVLLLTGVAEASLPEECDHRSSIIEMSRWYPTTAEAIADFAGGVTRALTHWFGEQEGTSSVLRMAATTAVVMLLFWFPLSAQTTSEATAIPRDDYYSFDRAEERVRRSHPEIDRVQTDTLADVITRRTIEYAVIGGRRLVMDLFTPVRKQGPVPVIVMFHGGGWRSGDRSMEYPMASSLAAAGYAAAAVEYRLTPEACFPAGMDDARAAVRFLHEHGAALGIRPDRIGVYGCSSGGHMASLLGAENRDPAVIGAVVNVDGPVDLTDPEERGKEEDPKRPTSAARWLGSAYAQSPELWNDASPIRHVSHTSAPVLFINSGDARYHAGRDAMIAKLQDCGITADVVTLSDAPHSFWLFHPWFRKTITAVRAFFDRTIVQ